MNSLGKSLAESNWLPKLVELAEMEGHPLGPNTLDALKDVQYCFNQLFQKALAHVNGG